MRAWGIRLDEPWQWPDFARDYRAPDWCNRTLTYANVRATAQQLADRAALDVHEIVHDNRPKGA